MNKFRKKMSKPGTSAVITAFASVVILIIIFALANPNFTSANNLMQMARSVCPYLLVGIGQGIVCISGNIDLSIGSVLGMANMISATMICNGVNPLIALFVSLLACLAAGVVNGLLVGKYKMPSFIATLGTMTICRGIAQLCNGNYNTGDIGSEPMVEAIRSIFYYGKIGPLYFSLILSLVILVIFCFMMNRSRTGRHIYAIGSNIESARFSGVNVFKTVTIAYVISAFCSWVAGIIILAATGMGSMQAGISYEMYAVAAAVIGGISTLGGSGLLIGVLAGALVWAVLQNGLTMANVPIAMRNILVGIIVVLCVEMDILRRSDSFFRKRKDGNTQNSNKNRKKILIAIAITVVAAVILGVVIAKAVDSKNRVSEDNITAKVALITMDQSDPHWMTMYEHAMDRVDSYNAQGNNLELVWLAPESKDVQQQVEKIGAAIADNVDYILIACTDSTAANKQLEEAKDAGIRIIYLDSPATVPAEATYGTNNYEGGVQAGEYLLDILTENGVTEGDIGIVDVEAGIEATKNRYAGFLSVFKNTDFNILERQYCGGDNSKGQEIANTYINNGVVAIYATNTGCTNGSAAAVREALDNGIQVYLVGWDQTDANMAHIESGELLGLMAQNPGLMGEYGIDAVMKLEHGIDLNGEVVDTGVEIITPENIEK